LEYSKKVLKYCPNYYSIIEFNPLKEDEITKSIIRIYREYIFNVDINDSVSVEKITNLDSAVAKYINDYAFRKEVQKQMIKINVKKDYKEMVKEFINVIIKLFTNYQEYTTRIVSISRWI